MFKENSVIFHFTKLAKTWKKGESPPAFELSVDHKSFKERKNNLASHKLYKSTQSGVCRHSLSLPQRVSETFWH